MRRVFHSTRGACKTGKLRYRDESQARGALRRARERDRARAPIRVYECPFCHGWHFTSQPERGTLAA